MVICRRCTNLTFMFSQITVVANTSLFVFYDVLHKIPLHWKSCVNPSTGRTIWLLTWQIPSAIKRTKHWTEGFVHCKWTSRSNRERGSWCWQGNQPNFHLDPCKSHIDQASLAGTPCPRGSSKEGQHLCPPQPQAVSKIEAFKWVSFWRALKFQPFS
jgi:hypothetical protein